MDVGEKGQTVIKEAEDLGIKEKPKFSLSSIPFLSGKNIFLLLLCMGLTYGFLEYVYPLILYIKYDKVKFALSRGQFDEASIVLAGLENKGKPEFKKMISTMINQVQIEKKNFQDEKYINKNINLIVQETVGMPIDLIYVRFHMTNEFKKKSLDLDPHHFYLKTLMGKGEICLNRLQNDEVSTGAGVMLGPRKATNGGICVKFAPAVKFDPEGGKYEPLFLVYNNGEDYVVAPIKPSRIMFHGAEYKFKDYW